MLIFEDQLFLKIFFYILIHIHENLIIKNDLYSMIHYFYLAISKIRIIFIEEIIDFIIR